MNEAGLTLLVGSSEFREIGFREVEKVTGSVAGEFPRVRSVVKGLFAFTTNSKASRIDFFGGGAPVNLSLLDAFLVPESRRHRAG